MGDFDEGGIVLSIEQMDEAGRGRKRVERLDRPRANLTAFWVLRSQLRLNCWRKLRVTYARRMVRSFDFAVERFDRLQRRRTANR
ncbi:MAG: hypothetical protein DLM52_02730 [Chthoniobacterales bacterium]|nr:MAG: hypothetical protein DLM52_02730 [Chthoniobacterales bacterium]